MKYIEKKAKIFDPFNRGCKNVEVIGDENPYFAIQKILFLF